MSFSLEVEGIKALLFNLLDKNPKLEEILQHALENRLVDLSQLLARPNSRIQFYKLLSARNIDEVSNVLVELEKAELNEVYMLLPLELRNYMKIILLFYDMDLLYSSLVMKSSPRLLFSIASELEELCRGEPKITCIIIQILRMARDALNRWSRKAPLPEDVTRALSCLAIFSIVKFYRHALNAKKLGLVPDEDKELFIRRVIDYIPKNPTSWFILSKLDDILSYVESSFSKDPSRVLLYEAKYLYGFFKELLLYSSQAIDLLTLYLINRYYELFVLRYSLPQSRVFR
jgi:hypothetical protein